MWRVEHIILIKFLIGRTLKRITELIFIAEIFCRIIREIRFEVHFRTFFSSFKSKFLSKYFLVFLNLFFRCRWSQLTLHNFLNYFVWAQRESLFYLLKCILVLSWLMANQFLDISSPSAVIPVIFSAILVLKLIRPICL